MSRSVDLFIDTQLSIDDLAEKLRKTTGAEVSRTADPGRWRLTDGSMNAELYEHRYLDDGDLWLSRYRYALSAHIAFGVSPLDSPEVLALRHFAQVLQDPPKLSVLLVFDFEYRLAVQGPHGRSPDDHSPDDRLPGDGRPGDGRPAVVAGDDAQGEQA